ncbi:hypothetical protein [Embleya sp. NPDC020630]|uniref:hypothetical protein n=1 Tax=Embleya sp. NPDC020630 TaxID=3363979 RepID=UPI00379CAC2D
MTEPTVEQLDNLLDHAHKRRLGPAEVDRIRKGIASLAAERDRWRRGYDHHYQRAERAEEADQRVRDYATGLKDWSIDHGLTAAGCADRILAALDAQPKPAADTETTGGRLSVADLAGGDPALSPDAKAARDAKQAFVEQAILSPDGPVNARIHHEPDEPAHPHVVPEAEAARHGVRQVLLREPEWQALLIVLDMRGLDAVPMQFRPDDLPTYITQLREAT